MTEPLAITVHIEPEHLLEIAKQVAVINATSDPKPEPWLSVQEAGIISVAASSGSTTW